MPRVLFIGDIVGRPGRDIVSQRIKELRASRQIDWVIANGENAAAGAGITGRLANELVAGGVDAVTLGDHVWDQKGFPQEIGQLPFVCRPANLDISCPGATHLILKKNNFRLGIFTVLGREFMKVKADCPFRCAEKMVETLRDKTDGIVVEIHAETTSEKVAMGWLLDGVASIVAGSHTHIPTADARILDRGTAYITDLGMTGPYASVLGREVEPVLQRFMNGMPQKFHVAKEDVWIRGIQVDLDASGRATRIETVAVSDTASEGGL